MNIPNQMQIIRNSLGLSQRDLATKMKIPHSTVVRMESGEYNISQKTIEKFCKATDTFPLLIKNGGENNLLISLQQENIKLKEKIINIFKIISN